MKVFCDEQKQNLHMPRQYMVHGKIIDPYETPERTGRILTGLKSCGLELVKTGDFGWDPILAVHPAHYVEFLKHAYERFILLPKHGDEVLPSTAAIRNLGHDSARCKAPRTQSVIGQAGWYIRGQSNAIMEGTADAAYASAQTAVAGAVEIISGSPAAYALCRPPGHHATNSSMAGFCFYNNGAIAVEKLLTTYDRVAVIDIDTHHGDGTQWIFYGRPEVFTGSVHTDPTDYYPHYTGWADETGRGIGKGANLNIPLAQGSGNADFTAAVQKLVDVATHRGSEVIVVAAGWDAFEGDPLSKLKVTNEGFRRAGEIIGAAGLPTLVMQEGGYDPDAIEVAAPAFMRGLIAAHPRL